MPSIKEGKSHACITSDTTFRAVRKLQVGDRLRITTLAGSFDYRVARPFIVKPEDVYVLAHLHRTRAQAIHRAGNARGPMKGLGFWLRGLGFGRRTLQRPEPDLMTTPGARRPEPDAVCG